MLLTLRCEESTQLLSDGFDRDLSRCERWAVRLHSISCRPCRGVRKQFVAIQRAAQLRGQQPQPLDGPARQEIREAIQKQVESP